MPKSTQRTASGSKGSPRSDPYLTAYSQPISPVDLSQDDSTSSSSFSHSPSTSTKPRCQNSACEPCRQRRVRCDRKDKDHSIPGVEPKCSNCAQRDFRCVLHSDKLEQPKPRLLRRGRRIQKVEAMFGENSLAKQEDDTIRAENIPSLQSTFFRSKFWRWFSLQHPILDAGEIFARFSAHESGKLPLNKEGQLLMMVITVWAASYGINEKGTILRPTKSSKSAKPILGPQPASRDLDTLVPTATTNPEHKALVNTMLVELVDYVDLCGLTRIPTWDGVRVLFLLYRILQDETSPGSAYLKTQNMLGVSLSQGRVLTTLTLPAPPDMMVRKSIFWYFYLEDGLTAGLEGRRLFFSEDDVVAFQNAEARETGSASLKGMIPRPFPAMDKVGFSTRPSRDNEFFVIPMDIGDLCRTMHSTLSSPSAMKRPVNLKAVNQLWYSLDGLWERLGALPEKGIPVHEELMDIDKFVATWKLVIFRCHNRIRDDLSERVNLEGNTTLEYVSALRECHSLAVNNCRRHLPHVVSIIQQQLTYDKVPVFAFDYDLVEDAVYHAAILTIEDAFEQQHQSGHALNEFRKMALREAGPIDTCLKALQNCQWLFSKSRGKVEQLNRLWRTRMSSTFFGNQGIPPHAQIFEPALPLQPPSSNFFQQPGVDSISDQTSRRQTPPENYGPSSQETDLSLLQRQHESSFLFTAPRPTTAHSEPGQCHVLTSGHKWTSYTPDAPLPPGKDARPPLPPINVSNYFTFAYSAPNTASSTESYADQWGYSPPSTAASSNTQPIESPISPFSHGIDHNNIMMNHHHNSAPSPTNDFNGPHSFVEDFPKLVSHASPVIYDAEPPAYDAAFYSQDPSGDLSVGRGYQMGHDTGNYQLEGADLTVHPPPVPPMLFMPPTN